MRVLLPFALLAALVTACTIHFPDGDDDDDNPRSGFLPCPGGCPDAGTAPDTSDAGQPWWDSDAGPYHGDAGCGDADGGYPYVDGGAYTPDAGSW